MAVFVYRPNHPDADENGMVDRGLVGYENIASAAPYVISDIMEPTRHMATGNYFTSKSEFRKETRRSGCVEVGNDSSIMPRPREIIPMPKAGADIKRAIEQLKSR